MQLYWKVKKENQLSILYTTKWKTNHLVKKLNQCHHIETFQLSAVKNKYSKKNIRFIQKENILTRNLSWGWDCSFSWAASGDNHTLPHAFCHGLMLMESSHSYLQYLSPLHPSKESHFVSHEFPMLPIYCICFLLPLRIFTLCILIVAKVAPKVCIHVLRHNKTWILTTQYLYTCKLFPPETFFLSVISPLSGITHKLFKLPVHRVPELLVMFRWYKLNEVGSGHSCLSDGDWIQSILEAA